MNSGLNYLMILLLFTIKNILKIGKEFVYSKSFLVAVGTKPRKIEFSSIKSNYNFRRGIRHKKTTKKILILGGGYIAVEFASIFNGLGVDVTMCIRGKKKF